MANYPYISGWCSTAGTPPGHKPNHGLCKGAYHSPATERVVRCSCSCHTGDEVPDARTSTRLLIELEKVEAKGGGRSSKLAAAIQHELKTRGRCELPRTGRGDYEDRKRGSRIWNAAEKLGMKVRISYKDPEKIIAEVK